MFLAGKLVKKVKTELDDVVSVEMGGISLELCCCCLHCKRATRILHWRDWQGHWYVVVILVVMMRFWIGLGRHGFFSDMLVHIVCGDTCRSSVGVDDCIPDFWFSNELISKEDVGGTV